MMSKFLLVLAIILPSTVLEDAWNKSKCGNYDESEKILEKISPAPEQEDLYNFYRFFNNFHQNNKKNVDKYSDRINIVLLPIRYQTLTILMQEESSRWSENDVDDISRDMRHVKFRLENYKLDKKTDDIQKGIIAKLDKLIDDLENPPKSNDSNGNNPIQNSKQVPLEESQIQKDGGQGIVDVVKFKKISEKWGSLPPRERAQVLQEMTVGMSPRHREQIENYFRNLSLTQSKK